MLVGLVGLKGSGKDTVGDLLVKHHNFYKVAYADPIKIKVCEMLGLNLSEYDGFKRSTLESKNSKNSKINGRDFVVGVGMMMREFDQNQFVSYVDSEIKKHKNVVVTDVRFLNEVDHLRKLNGLVVEVDRGLTNHSTHISEQLAGTGVVDSVLDNTKTLEHLKNEIKLKILRDL